MINRQIKYQLHLSHWIIKFYKRFFHVEVNIFILLIYLSLKGFCSFLLLKKYLNKFFSFIFRDVYIMSPKVIAANPFVQNNNKIWIFITKNHSFNWILHIKYHKNILYLMIQVHWVPYKSHVKKSTG